MVIEVDAKTNKMIFHTHNDKGELIQTFDSNGHVINPATIKNASND